MTLSHPFRIDSLFLVAGLSASAVLHGSLLFSPQRLTVPQDHAVQPSDFSLEISLIETSSGQPMPPRENVMTTRETSAETTSPTEESPSLPTPITHQISPKHIPATATTHISHTPASSTVLARPDTSQNSPPLYPEHARKKGWSGSVLLRALISTHGTVESVSLLQGSGYDLLDQAATTAVKQWRFFPKRVDGEPVSSVVEVPVKFSLKR